jgi:hypothetical protein
MLFGMMFRFYVKASFPSSSAICCFRPLSCGEKDEEGGNGDGGNLWESLGTLASLAGMESSRVGRLQFSKYAKG